MFGQTNEVNGTNKEEEDIKERNIKKMKQLEETLTSNHIGRNEYNAKKMVRPEELLETSSKET